MKATPGGLVPHAITVDAETGVVARVLRAVRRDPAVYHRVAESPFLNSEALYVVVFTAFAGALGQLVDEMLHSGLTVDAGGALAESTGLLLVGPLITVVGWLVESWLVPLIGTRLCGGTGSAGAVRRVFAYAYAANLLDCLRWLPVVGHIGYLLIGIWWLALQVTALQAALGLGTRRAVLLVLVPGLPIAIALLSGLLSTVGG